MLNSLVRSDKFFRYIEISLAIFFLLFLYVKSPFNQRMIFENISSNELHFISLEFYFYLIWIIILTFIYTILRKKNSVYLYYFSIWNIIAFLNSLIFKYGLDLTDEGWQMAKSWGITHGNSAANSDLIWGSSFINGLWISLSGNPSLIWARFASVLYLPLFCILIFAILKNFFSDKLAFISTLISYIFFYRTYMIYNSLNYYALPTLSLLLSFYFLTKFYKHDKTEIKYLILGAVFSAVCIHLKFTFAISLFIFPAYLYLFRVKNVSLKRSVLIYYTIIILTFIAGLILLSLLGGLDELATENTRLSISSMFEALFGNKQVNSSLNYSFSHLLTKYFKDLIAVIKGMILFIAFFTIIGISSKKLKALRIPAVITTAVFMLFYLKTSSDDVLVIFMIISALGSLLLYFDKRKQKDTFYLIFIFLSIFIISFTGSGMSFYSGLISFGFLGIIVLIICLLYTAESDRIDLKMFYFALVLFLVLFQLNKIHSPYRDLPVSYLNTMFRSPELFGVYSFKERVEVTDSFMDYGREEFKEEDKIIFVAMPMFYYLLDVKPVLSEPHDVILGLEQLKNEVVGSKPDIIVIPVQSPRGNFWPLKENQDFWKTDGFERRVADYYTFYKEYIKENNFEIEFENAMFQVYKKQVEQPELTE